MLFVRYFHILFSYEGRKEVGHAEDARRIRKMKNRRISCFLNYWNVSGNSFSMAMGFWLTNSIFWHRQLTFSLRATVENFQQQLIIKNVGGLPRITKGFFKTILWSTYCICWTFDCPDDYVFKNMLYHLSICNLRHLQKTSHSWVHATSPHTNCIRLYFVVSLTSNHTLDFWVLPYT